MQSTPRWIPPLFGSAMIVMGGIVLGALIGWVPTDGGRFLAPAAVIASLGLTLLIGGLLLWLPLNAPSGIRSFLFLVALGLLLVVCNWTAFAPEVSFSSTTSLGPFSISGTDQVGGRLVFGIAAAVLDLIVVVGLLQWIRSALHGPH